MLLDWWRKYPERTPVWNGEHAERPQAGIQTQDLVARRQRCFHLQLLGYNQLILEKIRNCRLILWALLTNAPANDWVAVVSQLFSRPIKSAKWLSAFSHVEVSQQNFLSWSRLWAAWSDNENITKTKHMSPAFTDCSLWLITRCAGLAIRRFTAAEPRVQRGESKMESTG